MVLFEGIPKTVWIIFIVLLIIVIGFTIINIVLITVNIRTMTKIIHNPLTIKGLSLATKMII